MPTAKRASSHATVQLSAAHTAGQPERLFDELTDTRVTMLRTVATVASAVASHHLSNQNFHRLLKFAHEQKVITADRLAEMGRADRTTASRWINGHNAPNPFAQESILIAIAHEAEDQARQLIE